MQTRVKSVLVPSATFLTAPPPFLHTAALTAHAQATSASHLHRYFVAVVAPRCCCPSLSAAVPAPRGRLASLLADRRWSSEANARGRPGFAAPRPRLVRRRRSLPAACLAPRLVAPDRPAATVAPRPWLRCSSPMASPAPLLHARGQPCALAPRSHLARWQPSLPARGSALLAYGWSGAAGAYPVP